MSELNKLEIRKQGFLSKTNEKTPTLKRVKGKTQR